MSQSDLLLDDKFENENNLAEINHAFNDSTISEHRISTKSNGPSSSNESDEKCDRNSHNEHSTPTTGHNTICHSWINGTDSISEQMDEQPKINNLNHLVLDLKWKTRDEIINNLNQFSALLKGKIVAKHIKMRMIEDNNDLILTLINLGLSMNLNDRESICRRKKLEESEIDGSKRKIGLVKRGISTELFLELSRNVRMKIIDHLIANQNLAITLNESISEEIKNDMVNENKNLINTLLNLPVDELFDESNEEDEAVVFEDDESISMRISVSRPTSKQVNILSKEIDDLRQQVNSLKDERLKELSDIHKLETTFTYKLNNVKEFLRTENNYCKSDSFYAAGIPWCIYIQTVDKKPAKKYFTFYLRPINTFDNYINWNCKTYYELRILSASPYIQNKVKQCLKTFTSYNYMDFSLSEEINNLEHFIRNDVLYLQCYLKAEKITRTSF